MENKLEDLFCSYKQALAVKELGFNEYCFGGWDDNKKWYWHPDSDIILDAPLKSQVFKWFREKYGLCSYIYPNDYGDEIITFKKLIGTKKEYRWHPLGNILSNKEEAESACIDKLIEIVKSKID